MQLTWLRSPLHRLIAVATGTAVAAGVSVTVWHELNASPAGTAIYSGVQAATAKGGGTNSNSGNANANPNNNGNDPHSFTIGGTLGDLYPGLSTNLVLTVDNSKNNQAIHVTSLTVTVGDASSDCPASNLSPASKTYTFSVTVARNSTDTTSFVVPIKMVDSAPDACQRAKFPLTLSGTATGPA
jgi:hypothetical protein